MQILGKKVPERRTGSRPSEKELPERRSGEFRLKITLVLLNQSRVHVELPLR
jgi:hypothetical protein